MSAHISAAASGGEGLGGGGLGGGDLKHCAHAPHVVHPHRCAHVCGVPSGFSELGHQFLHSAGGDGGGGEGRGGGGAGRSGGGSGGEGGASQFASKHAWHAVAHAAKTCGPYKPGFGQPLVSGSPQLYTVPPPPATAEHWTIAHDGGDGEGGGGEGGSGATSGGGFGLGGGEGEGGGGEGGEGGAKASQQPTVEK